MYVCMYVFQMAFQGFCLAMGGEEADAGGGRSELFAGGLEKKRKERSERVSLMIGLYLNH